MRNYKWLKIFFGGMSVYMVYLVIVTSLQSNLLEALEPLNQQPWFRTTIVDFYFNVAIISAWVFYREVSKLKAFLWTISFVCLGSITTCLYVLLQLMTLKKSDPLEKAILKKV